jgi:ferredoxin-NADP reductase
MESHKVKVLENSKITHNVRRLKVGRPPDYNFIPGQATEVSLPKKEKESRPFTFTGLTDWSYLEFSIKIYPDHEGVTSKINKLMPGDEIILHDVWGAIEYRGPGVFVAGGAGVTPFISILRDLYRKEELEGNKLYFSNKTSDDIILKDEFTKMLGDNFCNTLTAEKTSQFRYGKFDLKFFKDEIKSFNQHFYVCGPDGFVKDMNNIFQQLGAAPELLIFER